VILGASGFVGAHLVRAALAAGLREVIAVSRRPELRPRRDRDPAGAVRELALDLLAPGALATALTAAPEAPVILAAALARAAACERDPELAARTNAELPAVLAERAGRVVHVSTDLVFGASPPRGARYAEDDPPDACSVYGATKAAGERAVLAAAASALVVRLPLLYGDSGGRGLGASDQVRAQVAAGGRPYLFTDEHRTPLDVADAAAALVELALGDARGVLHVAGPERVSRLELGVLALAAEGRSAAEARAAVDAGPRTGEALRRPGDVSLDAAAAAGVLRTRLRGVGEVLGEG
jgi:dTDP-4-dehydrorhamnose reductase